jgi:hypothetical protein
MTLREGLKTGNSSKAHMGRKPLPSNIQEKKLGDHVLLLETIFYDITQTTQVTAFQNRQKK